MHKRNAELEAAILEDRSDTARYLVYGDWLQAEGDIFGEAVSLQFSIDEVGDESGSQQRALEALFRDNAETFFGKAPEDDAEPPKWDKWPRWGKPKDWPEKSWVYGFSKSVWRCGFMQRLFFDTGYWDRKSRRGGDEAVAMLSALLAAESTRFLERIDLREIWSDGEGPEMGKAITAICEAPCAANLKAIVCRGGDHDISGVHLDCEGVSAACPNLEELVLYGGQMSIETLDLPKLKRLAIRSGSLWSSVVDSVVKGNLPAIEDLEIWFGSEEYGADCDMSDVTPLLAKEMPKLKRLGLMNAEFGDDICEGILTSPLLGQLEELDLSMGVITDTGARTLLSAKAEIEHLSTLSLRGYFSDDVEAELKAAGWSVENEGVDDDDDYRYVEVGE